MTTLGIVFMVVQVLHIKAPFFSVTDGQNANTELISTLYYIFLNVL